ncbi:MAG: MFS transporter [Gammaproteobacteria bacterium]|nr:MFS transporter [Gammaproteobacteria bacterium]MDP6617705.1 MFS transporter [Gammaproteobacteria bacterium]MDP6695686.1 MFS transporter [Gammaproteobacteria bacterium]
MSGNSQYSLLGQKRFGPYFTAQFLGAFNDNVFKNALLLLIAFHAADRFSASSDTLINLSAGLFILPFFLFSATAGQLADKYEKSILIRLIKLFEIGVMILAAVALWLDSVVALIVLLFLMGMQSTLFGPVKYGILPQLLDEDELLGGNGLVEMGTFLAILLGTACGGILIGIDDVGRLLVAAAVVLIACAGYFSARGIPKVKAVDPGMRINWNPVTETWRILGYARRSRVVFLCIIGISWFWFIGAVYLAQLPNFSRIYLGGNEEVVTLLLALFSIGVGTGSLLCERLSGHRIDIGLVPFGAIGLTIFGLDLAFVDAQGGGELLDALGWTSRPGAPRIMLDILLLGMFGGFYIVPLYASVQQRTDAQHRSRVIAANNVLNALLMVVAAGLAISVLGSGYSIGELFLLVSVLNGCVAFYIFRQAPEFILRFCTWILIHTIYRIRVEGAGNIPEKGPVLLACNHVSYVDALVIGGCIRRPVRFVMYYKYFNIPVLRSLFKTARVIPIAGSREDPELLARAFERIEAALGRGEVVCIFPEGALTRTGEINPFRPGIEKILATTPVPVVPIALTGLWGTFFSRKGAGAMRRLPKPLWYRVVLRIGSAVPGPEADAAGLHGAVAELAGETGRGE